MTDTYGSSTHAFWARAYYGPGGRKGGKGRPGEREGDLCIAVEYSSAQAREIELDILRAREDVGQIHTGEWRR